MLARCRSRNITQYYASVLQPGTTELMIVMELMAASVFDVVSDDWNLTKRGSSCALAGVFPSLWLQHQQAMQAISCLSSNAFDY